MSEYKAIIGETVVSSVLNAKRSALRLTMASGKMFDLVTYGGCCSDTWIEHIDGEDALLGTIVAVEDIDMPDLGNVGTDFCPSVYQVKYYGLRITTDKGRTVLDYRNDSNGYYGGSLDLREVKP